MDLNFIFAENSSWCRGKLLVFYLITYQFRLPILKSLIIFFLIVNFYKTSPLFHIFIKEVAKFGTVNKFYIIKLQKVSSKVFAAATVAPHSIGHFFTFATKAINHIPRLTKNLFARQKHALQSVRTEIGVKFVDKCAAACANLRLHALILCKLRVSLCTFKWTA